MRHKDSGCQYRECEKRMRSPQVQGSRVAIRLITGQNTEQRQCLGLLIKLMVVVMGHQRAPNPSHQRQPKEKEETGCVGNGIDWPSNTSRRVWVEAHRLEGSTLNQ